MSGQESNSFYDDQYRATLPKPGEFARKVGLMLDLGVVVAYPSLEKYDIATILDEENNILDESAEETLRNLGKIEKAIGLTALQDLIDRHQENVAEAMSFHDVELFSDEEQALRQELDTAFVNDHLVFTK